MSYVFGHIPAVLEMISLSSVDQSCHQVPMGVQAAVQICPYLGDHFLQLVGTLLGCQLHQGIAH